MDVEKLLNLKQRQHEGFARMHELLGKSEAEKRDLSRTERAEYRQLEADVQALGEEIRRENGGHTPEQFARLAQGPLDGTRHERASAPDLLAPEQRMADWVRERRGGSAEDYDGGEFSLGRCLTSLVRRDRSHLTELEQRAMYEGADASGGFLIPEPLSAVLIDRLRNVSRVFQAGVTTVPMTVDELSLARLEGGASPQWKAENDPIAESDLTFGRVKLKARTLPLLARMSVELFDDLSPEASQLLEKEFTAALALEADRVVLTGNGIAPEPRGIRKQSGVNIVELGSGDGGELNGYNDIAVAISAVRQTNAEPNNVLLSARSQGVLDRFRDSTGQPLRPPPSVNALMPFLVTNQIPDDETVGEAEDCSSLYVAEWRHCLVGLRTDIRVAIRPLMERFADNLQIGFLAYLRLDVAMAHPETFTVITGIKGQDPTLNPNP